MKTINHYLTLLSVILLGISSGANAQCVNTFMYTGSPQLYTVPAGITMIQVDAQGAMGGNSFNNAGGCGGRIQCNMAVTAGQVIIVNVGGQGGTGTGASGGVGGFNDAGASGGNLGGGGGGGASDVRNGGGGLGFRIVVAGGGGGGGSVCALVETGGAGGNTTGGVSTACGGDGPGSGGTFASGGSHGLWGALAGTDGTTGVGGTGATGSGGGGGGGGYYGGGGGAGGGGGGGSSFAYPGNTSSVSMTQGYNCTGDGMIVISTFPVAGPIIGRDTLCIGSTRTFIDTASTGAGIWSSSNTAVGTIGATTGVAGGISAGTLIISYTVTSVCGTATATQTAIVGPGPIVSPRPRLCAGQINDTVSDMFGGGIWTSSATAIAVVGSHTGIVAGSIAGTVTISYNLDGCYATTQVTVNALPAPIIGDSNICQTLSTTFSDPSSGGIWSTSDVTLITIGSTSGFVTALSSTGIAHIVYTLPTGCRTLYDFYLTVRTPPSPLLGNNVICHGFADTLTMSVFSYITGGRWSSSDPTVATIGTDLGYPYGAVVLGVGAGTTVISYTIPGCPSADTTLTVNPLPKPIEGITSICTGLPVSLADSTPGGTWSSSDTTVAIVDSLTGVVTTETSILGSSTVIIYTLPTGCLITQVVTVNAAPAPITGPDSVCQGGSVTLVDTTAGGTWTSTRLAIAQVIDTSGVVDGVMAGSATISYTLPSGCYAALPFHVKPPIPASVSISRHPFDTICAGTPVIFAATTTNAGIPTFQWQRFSGGIPDSTRDSLVYTPIHGDYIICQVVTHGICSVQDTVYDTAAINVWPNVVPTVTISVADTLTYGGSTPIYLLNFPGQIFTFYATTTWGALTPTYQWYENRLPILGATHSSYSTAVYGNDTVFCVVSGYPPCDTILHTVTSNGIPIWGYYLGVQPLASTSNGFTVFPNPNSGGFTITGKLANASNNNVDIEVTDVLGNVVYTGKAQAMNGIVNQQVTLDNGIPSGSYVLRLRSDAERQVFHFVISK